MEERTVVEINGVKMEVDLRTARTIDTYKVGDRVKVLVKKYSDNYETHHGVIVAFDNFENLPTITVCYITTGYSGDLSFAYINSKSKDIELVACNDDVLIEKGEVLARLQKQIDLKKAEIEDIERKMRYFEDRFGTWFKTHD